jgi:hypothetical protein
MAKKPNIENSEMARAEKAFDNFNEEVKNLTMDRMNAAPKSEVEQQTKLSQNQIEKSNDIYLKPVRSISGNGKFNEKFRQDYEYAKEYVQFIAENRELRGSAIEIWTRPFPGMPAEYWEVPVNKPVWGPRHLMEQISRAQYHRLKMEDTAIRQEFGFAQMQGSIIADSIEQRLDAQPVHKKKNYFMGARAV